jgi:hypothetical protein
MRNYLFSVLFICFVCTSVHAQEIKATVEITAPRLQAADPAIFNSLQGDLTDFINNQRWTEDEFEAHERIECSISINILEELNDNTFKADIAIQSVRPVYGSEYKTPVITHRDRDFTFSYVQFQQLEDSRNAFQDNLSSVITFYMYLVLGLDYDTFEPLGGESHFETAQNIISSIPPDVAEKDRGWAANGRKTNRYWLLENLLNSRLKPYREAMYQYHIQSLDIMHQDTDLGINNMLVALNSIRDVNKSYPNTIALQAFSNTKADEIIEIFKNASRTQKQEIKTIMRTINPATAGKFNVLN